MSQSPEEVWHAATIQSADRAISLEGLQRFLREFKYDPIAESLLLGLIRLHGVSFKISSADIAQLTSAGASESLIKALGTAPVHVVIPSPPPTGLVAVSCEPLDCDVELDGRVIGRTLLGDLAPMKLPVGVIRVRAFRKDYDVDPVEQVVRIDPDTTNRAAFRLALQRRVVEAEGVGLFERMADAIGGGSLVDESNSIRAMGVLNVKSGGADLATWSAVTTISRERGIHYQLSRGGRRFELTLNNGDVVWKKRPNDEAGGQLEHAVRVVLNYQLSTLLVRLNRPSSKYLAGTTQSNELNPGRLRVLGENESYTITVDSDSRPAEVVLESAGLNGGTRILYSRYLKLGDFLFPQETEVVLPGGQDGVAIRFDRIEQIPVAKPPSGFRRILRSVGR